MKLRSKYKNYKKYTENTKLLKVSNQKTNNNTRNINLEARQLAQKLKLDDRIEQLSENQAFITIKDHKPNFPNNIKCRLINPAKSNLGKISKQILQEINKVIRQSTDLQQWQSTPAVIAWFKDFPNKKRCKFLMFDVVDFYLSISEKLLDNALTFAKQFVTISKDSINIIHHCRKSLLFSRDSAWIKNDGSLFDVTMGLYDGDEVCKLVGLFMLNLIALLVGKNNVGLYRDDGLAILENASGPESERIKKKIIKVFNSKQLKHLSRHQPHPDQLSRRHV